MNVMVNTIYCSIGVLNFATANQKNEFEALFWPLLGKFIGGKSIFAKLESCELSIVNELAVTRSRTG